MIETERLRIYPASKEFMKNFISSQTNDVLKAAYQEMLDGCLAHRSEWDWYAVCLVCLAAYSPLPPFWHRTGSEAFDCDIIMP